MKSSIVSTKVRKKYSKILRYKMKQKNSVFVRGLLHWGKKYCRHYPWRITNDPYQVFVAEFMLQRTAVDQVLDVYHRFMSTFSSFDLIARSNTARLSRVMLPLGLAYRVKRLKEIARIITKKYRGIIPCDEKELRELPGVGRYIANAVLCFAFNKDIPIVDANVIRVLNRVFSFDYDQESHKKDAPWTFLAGLIPEGQGKQFNWSILDLANLVCTPKNPKCEICPINGICDYYRRAKVE